MRRIVISAGVAAIAALAACSPSDTDFKAAAEHTIEDEGGQLGQTFTGADCETPGSTDVGTTFACTATGEDGNVHDFEARITADDEITVALVHEG